MSFEIDTTVSIAALLGGVVGALVTAFLSYRVQIAVRSWEDRRRRGRILLVHYIQITDLVAADSLFKSISKPIVDFFVSIGIPFDSTHKIAAWMADIVAESSPEVIADASAAMENALPIIEEILAKVHLDAAEVADFPIDGVLAYNRYAQSAVGLRIQFVNLGFNFKNKPSSINTGLLHDIYRSWRQFADAAGDLRAAVARALSISPDQLAADIQRSLKLGGTQILTKFADSKNIEKAIESLKATAASNANNSTDSGKSVDPNSGNGPALQGKEK